MIKQLLVAYDGSAEAEAAFNFGVDLAKTYRANLHVLSVVRLPEPPTEVETAAVQESGTEHYKRLFGDLHKRAAAAGITIKASVVVGHPIDQILHHANTEHADVIVIGHQTRGTLGRWFTGSVADRVVDHAQCTVIVVKRNHV